VYLSVTNSLFLFSLDSGRSIGYYRFRMISGIDLPRSEEKKSI
jgi:hypothetical protein